MKNAIREVRADPRQHIPSVLVITIASLFGVVIIDGIAILSAWMRRSEIVAESGTALMMIAIVGVVFFMIALFVSALVISNTFSIIVAGRSERIALLRLVGASSRRLRRSISAEGLLVGIVGTIAGALVGTGTSAAVVWGMDRFGVVHRLAVTLLPPWMVVPVLATVVVTWASASLGSRRIMTVSPMEATGQAQDPSLDEAGRRGKNLGSLACVVVGIMMLVGGVAVGQSSPLAIFIALPGGMLSFTGLVLGSAWVMPPVQGMVGRLMARGPAGRMAARNASRYPVRTARTTMGLVIGVTLIVMFAAAATNLVRAMGKALASSDLPQEAVVELQGVVENAVIFFSVLLGFSVLIAIIGVVNNLSLSVMQRTREIGLLRALGLSRSAVRATIRAEAAQLTVAAISLGIVLGIGYGWAGALSLLSAIDGVGFFAPAIPWTVLLATAVVAPLIVVLASLVPARRATRISPTTALAAT